MGLSVLGKLSQLYCSLVWESTVLLSLCTPNRFVFDLVFNLPFNTLCDRVILKQCSNLSKSLPPGCEFGQADMQKLVPKEEKPSGSTAAPAVFGAKKTGNINI